MKNIHEVEVKLEGKEWKDAVDRAFSQEQKKVNVPGFRKGKVPRNVYEKKYGTASLFYTAINNELGNMYAMILCLNQ